MTTTPSGPVKPLLVKPIAGLVAAATPKPKIFILPLIKQNINLEYSATYAIPSGVFANEQLEFVTQDIEHMILEGKAGLRLSEDEKKKIQSFEDLQKFSYSYTNIQFWQLPSALVEREKVAGLVELFFCVKKVGYPARNYLELKFAIEDYRPSIFPNSDPYSWRTQTSTHSYHSYMIELTEKEYAQEELYLQRLGELLKAVVEPEILRLFVKGPVADTAVLMEIKKQYAVQLVRIEQEVRNKVTEEYSGKIKELNLKLVEANANIVGLQREKEVINRQIEEKIAFITSNKLRTLSLDISNVFSCGLVFPETAGSLFKANSPVLSFQTQLGIAPYIASAQEEINTAVYEDRLKHTLLLGLAGSYYQSTPDYYDPRNEHLLYEAWNIQNYTVAGIVGYRFGYAPLEIFLQVQPGLDVLLYEGKTEFAEARSGLNGYFSLGGTLGMNWFLPIENVSLKALLGLTYTVKNQFRGVDGPDRLLQSIGVNITLRNIFNFYKKQE